MTPVATTIVMMTAVQVRLLTNLRSSSCAGMDHEREQDGPCDRHQERRQQRIQLVGHQGQEAEKEDLDYALAIHRCMAAKLSRCAPPAASDAVAPLAEFCYRLGLLVSLAPHIRIQRHVAQRESTSLTRKGSAVQSRPCLPPSTRFFATTCCDLSFISGASRPNFAYDEAALSRYICIPSMRYVSR